MTIWRMRIACWIPKVTNTLSEYVALIAFPTRLKVILTLRVLLFTKCKGTDPTPFLSYPRLKDEANVQYVRRRAGAFRIVHLRNNHSYGQGEP
jgi:hypothetical protein